MKNQRPGDPTELLQWATLPEELHIARHGDEHPPSQACLRGNRFELWEAAWMCSTGNLEASDIVYAYQETDTSEMKHVRHAPYDFRFLNIYNSGRSPRQNFNKQLLLTTFTDANCPPATQSGSVTSAARIRAYWDPNVDRRHSAGLV